MTPVTLSSKYRVVISRDIRRARKLVPGQLFELVVHQDAITSCRSVA